MQENHESFRNSDTETIEYDVAVVGGGIAGLSFAIRLKQRNKKLSVCVLEKGAEIGSHLLSGAVFETKALDELIPDWKIKNAPLNVKAEKFSLRFLTEKLSLFVPVPPQMKSKNQSYIISICAFAKWLAEQAEDLGVDIFAGFAAAKPLINEKDVTVGVQALSADGSPINIIARQTVIAEGAHGSIAKQIIEKYDLRKNSSPQTYGLGIKEVWEVSPEKHNKGLVQHTIGYPLSQDTYGGAFIYHTDRNRVSIGLVVGLDYSNPYLSPFDEFQKLKLHPSIKPLLKGGKRIAYGAKTIVEGGLQSLPKLSFKGGVIIGDSAGFLNVPKIKGLHTAMKSAIIAAESLSQFLSSKDKDASQDTECTLYQQNFKNSWLYKELHEVRNIRPFFRFGLLIGLAHAGFATFFKGFEPWSMKNKADHKSLKKAEKAEMPDYPKADDKITFDIQSSVFMANISHDEAQPCHLKLKDPDIPLKHNLPYYAEPALRYCPAMVYQIINNENGKKTFQINASNCIHCKTCDIKDPSQNISWGVPWGGSGPNYSEM